ncbi:RmlC-like cupin family protein [Tieghemostelium lacteum]|uniref:RmlC-like cupin family protein n=1 Tax=Tieghemostelium lacteum TaxID=361077 RepID=A0A152A2B0_TIELA|nr:RmlC-like cupin family protein [Tieghemostelium lacteum]|eukprot:KYR00349.1 RmlC-like cupin family protein [Tieghemostelium lacteum]
MEVENSHEINIQQQTEVAMEYKETIGVTVDESTKISNAIRDHCLGLLAMKEKQQYENQNVDITSRVDSILTSFLDIKLSNRLTHLNAEDKKTQLNIEKDKLDNLNLLHQNYVYEKNHLIKEIKSYSDFSISEFEPKLVSNDYFEKSITSDGNEITYFKPTNTDNQDLNRHHNVLNRLNFELSERSKKVEILSKLLQKKKMCQQIYLSKQTFLMGLPKQVKDLAIKVTPIQSPFNSYYNQYAFQLSKSLYVLYYSVTSFLHSPINQPYKSKLNIRINGDLEKATHFNRLSQQQLQKQQQQQQPLVHPLSVVIEYFFDNNKVQLQFYNWLQSNRVSCKVQNQNEYYLDNLFDQYNYLSSPQSPIAPNISISSPFDSPISTGLNHSSNGKTTTIISPILDVFNHNVYGKNYTWLEILCGQLVESNQNNNNNNSNSNNNFNLISNILISIYRRIETKISLEKQIVQLKKQQLKAQQDNSGILLQFISIQEEFDQIYKLTWKNSQIELASRIFIPTDYPNIPPLFQLDSTWISSNTTIDKSQILLLQKETLKFIEMELNCGFTTPLNSESFLTLIKKLESILLYLSDQSQIINNSKGRVTRGKLRLLPLIQDQKTLLWRHK